MVWAQRQLHLARTNCTNGCSDNEIQQLTILLQEFKEAMGQIFDIDDLPVPHAYFHALHFLRIMYGVAYVLAYAFEDYALCYVFVPLVMIGFAKMGEEFADPLGDGASDMPINELLLRCLIISREMLGCSEGIFHADRGNSAANNRTEDCAWTENEDSTGWLSEAGKCESEIELESMEPFNLFNDVEGEIHVEPNNNWKDIRAEAERRQTWNNRSSREDEAKDAKQVPPAPPSSASGFVIFSTLADLSSHRALAFLF